MLLWMLMTPGTDPWGCLSSSEAYPGSLWLQRASIYTCTSYSVHWILSQSWLLVKDGPIRRPSWYQLLWTLCFLLPHGNFFNCSKFVTLLMDDGPVKIPEIKAHSDISIGLSQIGWDLSVTWLCHLLPSSIILSQLSPWTQKEPFFILHRWHWGVGFYEIF